MSTTETPTIRAALQHLHAAHEMAMEEVEGKNRALAFELGARDATIGARDATIERLTTGLGAAMRRQDRLEGELGRVVEERADAMRAQHDANAKVDELTKRLEDEEAAAERAMNELTSLRNELRTTIDERDRARKALEEERAKRGEKKGYRD